MAVVTRTLFRVLIAVSVFTLGVFVPRELAWSAPETRIDELVSQSGETVAFQWPATHVGLRWTGSDDAALDIQYETNGVWSDWKPVVVDPDGETKQSGLASLVSATKVRTRTTAGSIDSIHMTAIDAVNGPRRLVTKEAKPVAAQDGLTAMPSVVRRSEWGANESLRTGSPEFAKVNRIVVHHTVTNTIDPNPAATVRAVFAFHTQGNGWSDIGYNFLIDRAGTVYEGRHSRSYAPGVNPTGDNAAGNGVIGAHAAGYNTGSIGISMLGNFVSDQPSAAQQAALTQMIAWAADKNSLEPTTPGVVSGHRDVGQSTCPGGGAYQFLGQWRQKASSLKLLAARPGDTPGYWLTGANGAVNNFGAAENFGSMAGKQLNAPVISMTRTPSNKGYWLLAADGGIFSFGDAKFHGSTGNIRLNQPVVGMASTPTGNGYWLVAKDGGIFTFGDAKFFGSTGSMVLNQPVVTMAATPSGNGYWLAAADGGIFTFGDAPFKGSTGNIRLNQPITTMASAGTSGYYLFAADGGVFAFNTSFYGSIPMLDLASFSGAVRAAVTSSGKGYYVLSRDGGVYTFGDARFHGAGLGGASAAGISLIPSP